MGNGWNLTILKLGGSLITFKDKPRKVNAQNIRKVARAIASAIPAMKSTHLLLLHGGGSFGHYYAKRYGLSREVKTVQPEHVATISAAMMELHTSVLEELILANVPCVSVLAGQIVTQSGHHLSESGKRHIETLFQCGVVPISFGNVLMSENGCKIISGDDLALAVVRAFGGRPIRVVFGMDVDGVFSDEKMRGKVIESIEEDFRISTRTRIFDVTGGIGAKIDTGLELAKLHADVYFINGSNQRRIVQVLSGEDKVKGTRIYAR